MRRLRQIDAAQDRHHQRAADESKRRHEIKVVAPTFIEQEAEEISGQASSEVLEGVDQAGSKSGHARAADVHRGGGPEERVGRVRRERNQDQKKDGGVGGSELGGGQNNDGLDEIKRGRDRSAPSLKNN